MKRMGLLLSLLILAAPLQALDPQLEQVIREGKIHRGLGPSVRASRFEGSAVLLGRPLAYESGVALYRFEKVETGELDYALVSLPYNPLGKRGGAPELRRLLQSRASTDSPRSVTGAIDFYVGGSTRCPIALYRNDSFNYLYVVTDLDWNAFKEWGSLNDEISSVETNCTGWFLFEHTNWAGAVLYVPPSTGIANLHFYGFGDKISAIQQDLP